MALLAVLLFICIVHGGRGTATSSTSCSYWYSDMSRACVSDNGGELSVLLVCGVYVSRDTTTDVRWSRTIYSTLETQDQNLTSNMYINIIHENSTSQIYEKLHINRSNESESGGTFSGLYYDEYTLYFKKTLMNNESYQCQITTENDTVSLVPFLYRLDIPHKDFKCNSSQYNCTWCANMSISACDPTMTEAFAHTRATSYSINMEISNADSLSIGSTLTRGSSNNQVATKSIEIPTDHATSDTRDSLSDRPPTLRPSVFPTAKDESSKNNAVFATLGGIGGAAVVILLIAIIILQCVSLRRRRKRTNYPVSERRDENENTIHLYSPPPSGPAEPSPYECAVVSSSTLPGYTCQNTESAATTADHVYEDAEKYLRPDPPTSCSREDGVEEDDHAAPDDDISNINALRTSVFSENYPPQKKQSRVHFDTPENDMYMELKVSDEGHDYAVLQRNTSDVPWLENKALDQCTALGPSTEKADQYMTLEPVQASDREGSVYAVLEERGDQDTSTGHELKDKSQEKSVNDFAVLSEVGGVTPPQRGDVTASQETALEENTGGVTPPQSKDNPIRL